MRHLVAVALALGLVALCVGRAQSNGQNAGEGDQISVAPATIALGGPVEAITVHTNLSFDSVGSVDLNGVEPIDVWADDRGDLAARFLLDDLLEVIEIKPPDVTLTLTNVVDGTTTFEASDTVKVTVCKQK